MTEVRDITASCDAALLIQQEVNRLSARLLGAVQVCTLRVDTADPSEAIQARELPEGVKEILVLRRAGGLLEPARRSIETHIRTVDFTSWPVPSGASPLEILERQGARRTVGWYDSRRFVLFLTDIDMAILLIGPWLQVFCRDLGEDRVEGLNLPAAEIADRLAPLYGAELGACDERLDAVRLKLLDLTAQVQREEIDVVLAENRLAMAPEAIRLAGMSSLLKDIEQQTAWTLKSDPAGLRFVLPARHTIDPRGGQRRDLPAVDLTVRSGPASCPSWSFKVANRGFHPRIAGQHLQDVDAEEAFNLLMAEGRILDALALAEAALTDFQLGDRDVAALDHLPSGASADHDGAAPQA